MKVNAFFSEKLKERIEREMEEGVKTRDLASKMYETLGFKTESSALEWINYVRKGYVYGTTSNRPLYPQRQLDRLSVLLYELGVGINDSLVVGLRTIECNFHYPPEVK